VNSVKKLTLLPVLISVLLLLPLVKFLKLHVLSPQLLPLLLTKLLSLSQVTLMLKLSFIVTVPRRVKPFLNQLMQLLDFFKTKLLLMPMPMLMLTLMPMLMPMLTLMLTLMPVLMPMLVLMPVMNNPQKKLL